ncbi:hypothetical protein GWI72_08790 [Microvirga tunisiensis]|uniref:Uncharacterized protein n=2 Tax=Pannonibacter tanglangensis TaxID=2750084 RepID=A0ABW9ZGD0_9HYPH|nr:MULTISPECIES: hypothetical protein [unclassified Pannonibacter]NBN62706.1 hypothetical protein [Pannonibacter sp. XCT-34]NBN78361.1 hypothetical protein [Pannonibacter sp. XCT-53]
MIYTVLGLPGPFTRWCRAVVCELIAARGERAADTHIPGSLADIATELLRSGTDHLVVSAGRPDVALMARLKEYRRPMLLALSDPRQAALHLFRAGKADERTSVRLISGDCSCLVDFHGVDHVTRLHVDEALADPLSAIQRIADVYGLATDAAGARRILERTVTDLAATTGHDNGGPDARAGLVESFGEAVGAAADYILGGFDQMLAGNRDVPLIITKEFFLAGDPPHDHVAQPLDMTGRARFIAFGPYMHIPAGAWALRYVVGFSAEAMGTPCIIDVGVSEGPVYHELTRAHMVVSSRGRMEISLSFEITDPLMPMQVRLLTEKAIFDGRMAIGYAEFRRKSHHDAGDLDTATLLPPA